MAKTGRGKKIVCVNSYTRNGKRVRRHKRSTPN